MGLQENPAISIFVRGTLAFVSATILLGALWFMGDPGTILGFVGGIAIAGWVILWNQTGVLFYFCGVLSLIGLLATAASFASQFEVADSAARHLYFGVICIIVLAIGRWVFEKVWR